MSGQKKGRPSWVEKLGLGFVAQFYPSEIDYVPIVWEHLRRHELLVEPTDEQRERLGGLAFAAGSTAPLVTPFVIVTLEATIRELVASGHMPEMDRIEQAVRRSAEAFGASGRLAEELSAYLSPRLHSAFADGTVVIQPALRIPEATAGQDKVQLSPEQLFIDRYVNGKRRKCGPALLRVRYENMRNPRYDIVVDEVAHIIQLRIAGAKKPTQTRIDELQPKVAGMLWLVLVYFGRKLEYREIRRYLRLNIHGNQDNSIHQSKAQLCALVGNDLAERVFGKPGSRSYFVRLDGISYCWMRLASDPHTSDLLHRAGYPFE